MTTKAAVPERASARERLLAAAQELFYEEGISTVGIDRVIERAGVAKASLYNTFGSKDELIRAYLMARHEARRARITARLARHHLPREKMLAVFEDQRDNAANAGSRGCAFVRASAELQGENVRSVCDETRAWLLGLFRDLARDAGASEPAKLARQLALLYDGAAVSNQMDARGAASQAARDAAMTLLEAHGVVSGTSGK